MTRQTTIPIFAPDDLEELARLHRQIQIAKRQARIAELEAPRAGDDSPDDAVRDAEAAYDAYVDEATDRAEMWTVATIGFREFRALRAAHLPRKVTVEGEDGQPVEDTHPDDAIHGVNTETFPEALMTYINREDGQMRTILAPEFPDEAAMVRRVRRLAEGELETLWNAAWGLNKGAIADPQLSRSTPRTT